MGMNTGSWCHIFTAVLTVAALLHHATSFSAYRPMLKRSAVSAVIRPGRAGSGGDDISEPSGAGDRRTFLTESVTTAAALALINRPSTAIAEESISASSRLPFCVIGSNGRTGSECVGALVDRGIPVRATSRSGSYLAMPGHGSKLLTEMACDVTKTDTIGAVVRGSSAVIFAASASKEGGTPSAVDNTGLVNVAEACLSEGVPHLVIVSSGAVTKPSSPVYLFLNLFGNIMEEKIRGEDSVRALYAKYNSAVAKGADGNKELAYTIIRPGGLTMDPPRGAAALELNQGDTKSGRISRVDVAALCVEAVNYPQYTSCSTFECYDGDTGAPLASVGLSNIMKAKRDGKDFVSGRECRGETWNLLFSGLEKDDSFTL
mmetsp:Transcript_60527/g.179400  ORF Transcript_60527/g.179400 Transcript_60527/m.179400 type:complete len:375 (-) Transcript_60527:212-1336(-)